MSEGRVVVTGITGCVGAAVARAFGERGWTVRGLVRDGAHGTLDGCETHRGDLLQPASLRGLCQDADVVVHTAAMVSDWDDSRRFREVNVEGTRALLDEALRQGVRRFVYVSTIDVFGFRRRQTISEGSVRLCPRHPYSRTKVEAENLAWSCGRRGLEVSVVYPGWIYGPGDRHFVPELVDGLRTGALPHFDRGELPIALTYSENLADAIALVATSEEAAGEGYIVADDLGLTFGAFLDVIAREVGVGPPRFSLPFAAAWLVAAGSEAVAKLTRSSKRPLLTRYAIRSTASGVECDTRKIRALGYRPRVGAVEGVRRTLAALEGEAQDEREAAWLAPVA